MIEKYQIAVLIVLYYEEPPSYIYDDFGCSIIVVDNTPNRSLSLGGDNIIYLALKHNMGIAYALNIGMKIAIDMRKRWVITMDQDSILSQDLITSYIDFLNANGDRVGIVSPLINMYEGENKSPSGTVFFVDEALSSGSMINADTYQEVGGFKDEMFIDIVDFEFCWNIRKHGYKVAQINNVIMQHHLGNTVEFTLFGRHLFYVTNHNRRRRYYMTRNTFYLYKLYPEFRPSCIKTFGGFLKAVLKILFFEKDRLGKMKAMALGYKDYCNNQMGECPYPF